MTISKPTEGETYLDYDIKPDTTETWGWIVEHQEDGKYVATEGTIQITTDIVGDITDIISTPNPAPVYIEPVAYIYYGGAIGLKIGLLALATAAFSLY